MHIKISVSLRPHFFPLRLGVPFVTGFTTLLSIFSRFRLCSFASASFLSFSSFLMASNCSCKTWITLSCSNDLAKSSAVLPCSDLSFIDTPFMTKSLTSASNPLSAAFMSVVFPSLSIVCTFAPWCIRTLATLTFPFTAATLMSGVHPTDNMKKKSKTQIKRCAMQEL